MQNKKFEGQMLQASPKPNVLIRLNASAKLLANVKIICGRIIKPTDCRHTLPVYGEIKIKGPNVIMVILLLGVQLCGWFLVRGPNVQDPKISCILNGLA